ncbi:hypothetical protein Tco_0784886 [Tanacetum coccineum]
MISEEEGGESDSWLNQKHQKSIKVSEEITIAATIATSYGIDSHINKMQAQDTLNSLLMSLAFETQPNCGSTSISNGEKEKASNDVYRGCQTTNAMAMVQRTGQIPVQSINKGEDESMVENNSVAEATASKIASMEEDESMDSDHNIKVDNDIKNDTAMDLGEGADDDRSAKVVMKNKFALPEDTEELDQ